MRVTFCRGADVLAINIDGNMPYDICDDDETLDVIESEMGRQNIRQEDIDEKRKVPEMEMLRDMKEVLKRREDLNKLDRQGAAPLHVACCLGYEEVARFLLDSGADPNLADAEGWLPTHIAVCWCQVS
ncbi:hypothetical protein Ciccas_011473 [Cichlidogyrus casuarinus]|uniref:ANK_REP_REGION domain-containing protein n=1 Tax=Cichlidogyrus casuarinus TaxID=1844966 RepID=A0ABD2PT89_9PLAT